MLQYRSLLILGALLLSGCEQLFPPDPDPAGTGPTTLKSFASEEEYSSYVRGEIVQRNNSLTSPGVVDPPNSNDNGSQGDAAEAPEANGSGVAGGIATISSDRGDFSGTTLQEAGVDEADVVKTDGDYLYLIDDTTSEGGKLRIVRISPRDQLGIVAELPLSGYGRDLYLHNGKIIAITADYGNVYYFGGGIADGIAFRSSEVSEPGTVGADDSVNSTSVVVDGAATDAPAQQSTEPGSGTDGDVGDAVIDGSDLIVPIDIGLVPPYEYVRPSVTVTVVDVSNPAAPSVLSKTTFDGSLASSRMIDGVLHLLAANYQNYFYDVIPRLGAPDLEVGAIDAQEVLPRYTRTNADGTTISGDVLAWTDLYRPTEPDGFGIVAIVSLNVDNDAAFQAVGIVAEPGLIYSSTNALYITNTNYDWSFGNAQQRTTTDLYKLSYTNGRAVPVAGGRIQGRILNQYSLGEHNGILRVATTTDPLFGETGQISEASNGVYTLQEVGGALEVLGRIENIALGESIQSARFIGDRGYLVTFRQIDPLFTMDLTNPADPRIVGELKVPGFSTFLVPMDDDHLLAVGQFISEDPAQSWGVQLSIFDVADFANPSLKHSVVLGAETGAWSEALYDPKAFTYFAEQGTLALPISIYPDWSAIEPVVVEGDASVPKPVSAAGETAEQQLSPDSSTSIAIGEPYPVGFDGLVVFRVSAEAGFTELGRISTNFDDPADEVYPTWTSYTRGVFAESDVFAVTNAGIRGAAIGDVGTISYSEFYGEEFPILAEPIFVDSLEVLGDSEEGMSADGSSGSSSGGSNGTSDAASVRGERALGAAPCDNQIE